MSPSPIIPPAPFLPGTRLLNILTEKFLPVVRSDRTLSLVVATSSYKSLRLPAGIKAVAREVSGPRVALRNRRYSEKFAYWPTDGLQVARVPVFVFVGSGSADIRLGNYILTCRTGTVVFIPAGVPYPDGNFPHLEGAAREGGYCELMWLIPVGGGLDFWACHSQGEEHRGTAPGEKVFLPNNAVRRFVNSFEGEIEANKYPDPVVLQNLLRILIISIHRDLLRFEQLSSLGLAKPELPENLRQQAVTDLIAKTKLYILANLSEPLSLDSLARRIGMSRTQFTRCFRAHMKISVNEYISNCRLERAKALLAESDWSTASITRITGLRSADYFRRFFFKHMQITPTQYRMQVRTQKGVPPVGLEAQASESGVEQNYSPTGEKVTR
jgi:AraC-like DNA-binding protein